LTLPIFKEIGSNFWLEPELLEERDDRDPVWRYVSDDEQALYTSSGRGAISLLLGQIESGHGRALLPLYTCESVIMPFLKKGYAVHFYDINIDLTVNEENFMESVERYKPEVVLLHAYFGFDALHDLRVKYQGLREKNIIVIEDITHSLFGKFEKTGADYYLASFRKWFSLPDGGLAISIQNKIKADKVPIHEELVKLNVRAIRMKYEYTQSLDARLKTQYRKLFYSTEELLNNDCGFYAMSKIAKTILGQMDFNHLRAARRSNFLFLLDKLKKNRLMTPVFNQLPDDVVPLYFPVYVNGDRVKLRAFLAENEIYAPIHWEIPSECAKQLTKKTKNIYEHILSLPCDQRYANEDMERIINRLSVYPG
jgi:dTDP-4-amino-4,6-dideoxygalactose transaminase